MRALILDCERDDGLSMIVQLQRSGYETRWVASVPEAVAALHDEAVDLVVMEFKRPSGHIVKLCEDIRERFGHGPIIIFAGCDSTVAQRVACLQLGADDFMVKPVDTDELIARI